MNGCIIVFAQSWLNYQVVFKQCDVDTGRRQSCLNDDLLLLPLPLAFRLHHQQLFACIGRKCQACYSRRIDHDYFTVDIIDVGTVSTNSANRDLQDDQDVSSKSFMSWRACRQPWTAVELVPPVMEYACAKRVKRSGVGVCLGLLRTEKRTNYDSTTFTSQQLK